MQGLYELKAVGQVVGDDLVDAMVERPVEGLVELEVWESRGESRLRIQ